MESQVAADEAKPEQPAPPREFVLEAESAPFILDHKITTLYLDIVRRSSDGQNEFHLAPRDGEWIRDVRLLTDGTLLSLSTELFPCVDTLVSISPEAQRSVIDVIDFSQVFGRWGVDPEQRDLGLPSIVIDDSETALLIRNTAYRLDPFDGTPPMSLCRIYRCDGECRAWKPSGDFFAIPTPTVPRHHSYSVLDECQMLEAGALTVASVCVVVWATPQFASERNGADAPKAPAKTTTGFLYLIDEFGSVVWSDSFAGAYDGCTAAYMMRSRHKHPECPELTPMPGGFRFEMSNGVAVEFEIQRRPDGRIEVRRLSTP